MPAPLDKVRVAVVYDCFFPLTVGGAERWYRQLSEALATDGASVTYLTRRQWDDIPPDIGPVDVVAVSGKADLYDEKGVRKLGPGLSYGYGVFRHLRRNRGSYDLVHLANFPFWSVIAARLALLGTSTAVIVDWHEIWSLDFWRSYAGFAIGTAGYLTQRLCITLTTNAIVTSRSNGARLRAAGLRGEPTVLPGYLPPETLERSSDLEPSPAANPPYVLFAGRHIFDKGVDLLPGLAQELKEMRPSLHLVVAGNGPSRPALQAEIRARSLQEAVTLVGFVDDDALQELMRDATCVVVPSRREGYGMVLVEATSHGTPVAVAPFPENLAAEHVEDGLNGYVARLPTAEGLADAVRRVAEQGMALRRATLAWYRQAAATRTVDHSIATAIEQYQRLAGP